MAERRESRHEDVARDFPQIGQCESSGQLLRACYMSSFICVVVPHQLLSRSQGIESATVQSQQNISKAIFGGRRTQISR